MAEAIIGAGEARGGKKLYDAYEIPCETPPPLLWTSKVKAALEAELAKAMKLEAPPEVVHIAIEDASPRQLSRGVHEEALLTHYLVVRFAGSQVGAVKVEQGQRHAFWYYPARDATLVYAPGRRCVEAFAHHLALRAPMANALATHGFKVPLSHRPLNRARYDLTPFARSLKDCRPRLACGKVERMYLTEAKALIGHASDTVKLEMQFFPKLCALNLGWRENPERFVGSFIEPRGALFRDGVPEPRKFAHLYADFPVIALGKSEFLEGK